MEYDIRLCRKDEVNKLLNFIEKYWNSSHIFLNDRELLDWQHLEGGHYNFVVANHKLSNEFHGILGFISPGYFASQKVIKHDHLWLAIWKVERSLVKSNSLGIDLLTFLKREYAPVVISAIGINGGVSNLYRLMGFKVDKLVQSFLLSNKKRVFNIARVPHIMQTELQNGRDEAFKTQIDVIEIKQKDLTNLRIEAFKFLRNFGACYLNKRFFEHPTYSYLIYCVKKEQVTLCLFVGRILEVDGSKCFRVVDFWGLENSCEDFYPAFQKILSQLDCEYVDIISSKIDFLKLHKIGFKENNDNCYAPHLFEPFCNHRIEVSYASTMGDVIVFKADSDLDRPSLRKNNVQ